jgi:hypothetical protein
VGSVSSGALPVAGDGTLTRHGGLGAAAELEAALSCAHVPNHILRMLGAVVDRANIPEQYEQSMNLNIVRAPCYSTPSRRSSTQLP